MEIWKAKEKIRVRVWRERGRGERGIERQEDRQTDIEIDTASHIK